MSNGITTLVATRDRPEQAYATWMSHEATKVLPGTRIVFGIDFDEPQYDAYYQLLGQKNVVMLGGDDSGSLTKVTNALAAEYADDAYLIGSVGDDHRFRTTGWDAIFALTIKDKSGIVYGDDLYQGVRLPTAAYMTTDIYNALGWFALPTCDHMYIDNAWLAIGQQLKKLYFLPNVVIEHMHYSNGKAKKDESYIRTNSDVQKEKDRIAFNEWVLRDMRQDIARIERYLNYDG